MSDTFAAGDVLQVGCLDPQGRNPKLRPVVVFQVGGDGSAQCVAVSGEYGHPLPPTEVRLPHASSPRARCSTGLTKPCAAVCTWRLTVPLAGPASRLGAVPSRHLLAILTAVEAVAGHTPPPAE